MGQKDRIIHNGDIKFQKKSPGPLDPPIGERLIDRVEHNERVQNSFKGQIRSEMVIIKVMLILEHFFAIN